MASTPDPCRECGQTFTSFRARRAHLEPCLEEQTRQWRERYRARLAETNPGLSRRVLVVSDPHEAMRRTRMHAFLASALALSNP